MDDTLRECFMRLSCLAAIVSALTAPKFCSLSLHRFAAIVKSLGLPDEDFRPILQAQIESMGSNESPCECLGGRHTMQYSDLAQIFYNERQPNTTLKLILQVCVVLLCSFPIAIKASTLSVANYCLLLVSKRLLI